MLGTLVLWIATHRVDAFYGGLWPVSFSWRWTPRPDETLAKPDVGPKPRPVPLDQTTASDFPQFLGPDRNNAIDRIRLEPDWQKHPPALRWKQPIGAGHSGFAVVNGFAVTLEQRGPEELVTCYDALIGHAQWSYSVKARHSSPLGGIGPRSTPTIHEGKVYAFGATGVLSCLKGADGTLIWSRNLLDEVGSNETEDRRSVSWGRAGSPLIVDNLVVVPGGGPSKGTWYSLLAFDKETGKPVWRGGSHQISYRLAVAGPTTGPAADSDCQRRQHHRSRPAHRPSALGASLAWRQHQQRQLFASRPGWS